MISFLMIFLISPISCLLLWNKMIVTVDAFMHACILSSILYIKFSIPIYLSMSITAFLFTLLFEYLKKYIEKNESLQIISVVFMSITCLLIPKNMTRILFGNIDNITLNMIYMLIVLIILIYVFIYLFYNRIILISLNPTLDRNLNGDNTLLRFIILLIVCITLGCIIEYLGTIFIVPMVILPGIISRFFVTSPFQMIYTTLLLNLLTLMLAKVFIFFYFFPINQIIIIINFITLLLIILKKEIFHIK